MPKCRLCNEDNSVEELHTICYKSDNHSIWCTNCIKDIIEKAENKQNIILTCQLCNSENQLIYEMESTFERSIEYNYKSGKLHGENVIIYATNEVGVEDYTKIKSIGNYNNGILNGKYVEYMKDINENNIKIICNYENGILDGIYSTYMNDKILYEEIYENGIKNGAKTYYYINKNDENDIYNGRIQSIEMYKNGQLNGPTTTYDLESRNKISEINYVNGKKDGLSIIYEYSDENILINKIENIYKDDKLYNGVENTYYDNNQIKSNITCINGNKVVITYYENVNGKIKSEAHYQNEVLHGSVKDYDIYGNLVGEEFYNNGKLDGMVIKHIYKENVKNISINGIKKDEKKIDNKSYSYSELLKNEIFIPKEIPEKMIVKELQKRRPRDVEIFRKNQFSDFGSILGEEEDKGRLEEQFSNTHFSEHKNMMNDEDPFIRKIKEFSFM